MASRSSFINSALPGTILLAVHDFVARSADELSLAKGDRIELIERDDDFGDGWFLGKHLINGSSGLFPEASTACRPPVSTHAAAPVPAVNVPGGRNFIINSDSPVMSETLSVIDEHITDMRSPRTSHINGNGNGNGNGIAHHSKRDTVSSVYSAYSSQPSMTRHSYIAGHETDEEEQQTHTEDEVMAWTPTRVAEYLEDHGVEKSHCQVFVEQEISGEVLLAMDQNSLFIKEFELGSVGRRLKTWHKIKALQDEVRRTVNPERERSASEYSGGMEGEEEPSVDGGRNRSSTIGAPSLPRGLSTGRRQSGETTPVRQSAQSATNRDSFAGMSPLQSMTSTTRPENTMRPSAQSIRNMNHSQRHSSIDSTSTDGASRMGHRKQPSIDQKWQPGQVSSRHGHTTSADSQFPLRNSSIIMSASPADVDRGYFSEAEPTARSRRSLLTKRKSTLVSPMHSRNSSVLERQPGRIAEAEGYQDPASPMATFNHRFSALNAVNDKFGNYRSATDPAVHGKPNRSAQSPVSTVVTKLDRSGKQSLGAIAASPTKMEDDASVASSEKATPSPSGNFGFFSSARAKVTGLRSSSDAVTKNEKSISPPKVSSPTRTTTGSSTPSTENRSMDIAKSDGYSRESTGSGQNLMPPPPSTKRPRAKSKKFTSAYTRGLEKKSPQEQMLDCDYSGWMKKKSGSLVATWKSRLFVLKGRRLSYYYTDGDTEEKGLIDISFHRVLPAQNETLTGVLASVTGAGGSPTSPTQRTTPTIAQQDLRNHPPMDHENDEGLFIFKLVPPKAGLSKGVNFTKPTVHYFAVKSRQEGRLWMAALMKATIDRDDTGVVTTTYNQRTISLAKARARRERPPALKEEGVDGRAELDGGAEESSEQGLGIGGLNEKESTVGGAEQERNTLGDRSSIATSTQAPVDTDVLSEKEREAVALNGSA
ncbi:related to budding BOI2 [Lecanosticta acicola]|uniref:Related to budding BOI2 n=1 Tax=Lecanosticta acicola TaxID=111012 RepID=A0AAI8YWD8_9PEZI|nr:related to budding BOI2 [Lecanosticta acicola]